MEKKTLTKVIEQDLIKKGNEMKGFIQRAEANLAEALKKEIYGLKSEVEVSLYGNQVKIYVGPGLRGSGDIIIYLEKNKKTSIKDRFRITDISTPGVRRSLDSRSDKDILIIIGKLATKIGKFGNLIKRYVEEYNRRYDNIAPPVVIEEDKK